MSPPTRPQRRSPRGQAAAMMAATMMLIALMVCVTLGVGMKVREKAEVQTLADVSAYSGAVVTARTFNSIAILNRVGVAQMVSAISTQSLVSYAGYYRTSVWAARDQFVKAKGALICPDLCGFCTRYQDLIDAADREITRIEQQWVTLDGNANRRLDDVIAGEGGVYGDQRLLYDDLIQGQLVGAGLPPLANAITQRVDQGSQWQGEMTAPATVNPINQRELGKAALCDPASPGAICYDSGPAEIPLQAAMGSRWYPFVRNAANLSRTLEDGLVTQHQLVRGNGENALVGAFEGSTRFVSSKMEHGQPGGMGLMGEAVEGQLELRVTSGGCGVQSLGPVPVGSYVYSTSYLNTNDDHVYTFVNGAGQPVTIKDPPGSHRLDKADCRNPVTIPCGLWPGFVDLNPGHVEYGRRETHLYGQPKIVSVVERNYAVRPTEADPWNLLYTMRIGQSSVEQFDNKGITTAQGLDISRQTAIATGLAYYHRQGHWKEPPNFFNPYWRATLVSSAIDLEGNPFRGGTDLKDAANNAPFARDVIDELTRQGFRGWQ